MLSIKALQEYGANTAEGMARCLNNEAFYIRLVGMALGDANFDRLRAAMEADDAKAVFEAAHALKGSLGNLALTPILDPVSQLTELMRSGGQVSDGRALADRVFDALDKARALL